MRLGPSVLLEIVSIVQDGLLRGTDISQRLRDLDVRVDDNLQVALTSEYLLQHPRAGD